MICTLQSFALRGSQSSIRQIMCQLEILIQKEVQQSMSYSSYGINNMFGHKSKDGDEAEGYKQSLLVPHTARTLNATICDINSKQ